MTFQHTKIAVVIPCYRVADKILQVLEDIPDFVDRIYCIDDACPESSGTLIENECTDARVTVLRSSENKGVGGATKKGYVAAQQAGYDIAIKLDGDGQMDPSLIPSFLRPILSGDCDYSKGNRFFRIEDVRNMPRTRLFGNAVLSFFTKLSSGYWTIFDPTNGYTALHLSTLDLLALDKVANRYFFETDMLFRLNIARCVVCDVPMAAKYGDEKSSLKTGAMVMPFLAGHLGNFFKRIFYSYFLRDFNVASIQLLLGPALLLFGIVFGIYHWSLSIASGVPATAGTVMIVAVSILSGIQLLLSAIGYDMANTPREAIHRLLPDENLEAQPANTEVSKEITPQRSD